MKFLCDKILIVRRLHKCAENGVFSPNISAMDNAMMDVPAVCRISMTAILQYQDATLLLLSGGNREDSARSLRYKHIQILHIIAMI